MRASPFFLLGLFITPTHAVAATLDVTLTDAAGQPVRNAVVSVAASANAGGKARFAFTPMMSQRNIQFMPGLLVVPVGTAVGFPNYDKVRHHVYSFSKAKKFELKLYGRDETRSILFDRPGTVAVGCNIHDAMRGFIRVVDTPWAAVSDARGRVVIAGLPGGQVRITIWHPALRAKDNELALSASGQSSKTIQIPVPAGAGQ